MFKKTIVLLAGALVVSSCATNQLHRGVVAMKIDDRNAHVTLNKNEVAVGDHVELFGNKCVPLAGTRAKTCERVEKGHGVVTEVLNDNYSAIKFDSGVTFQEGDFIEKHSH
ncbi:MAG: hypothetical protein H7256_14870 [Bdellovibrio sp.]|nr:hypothetical protein [Bdellovibrio sp.]